MRAIALFAVAGMLMATVGVYAASMTGTAKTLGGTGAVTVSAPASSVSIAWTTNASGQATAGNLTWTPAANLNYSIRLNVGSSTGTASITGSGTTQRTDALTLDTPVAADAVTSASVVITET